MSQQAAANHFKLVNYDSRGELTRKLLIYITTLES